MKYKKYFLILVLLLISIIPLLDLFHPGLPITHDGQDHVARIANFYQNLTEGNIIPRWAGNLNWGYGHPILMFLYPFPSYVASLFHLIGFSLIDSTKIVFGLAFILSGLTMYFFVKELLDEKAGFVASVLYLFAPYRFVDLYVRGAIGEHMAFIFPPLILFFLLKLSKKYSYWHVAGGATSLAGLILSHNAITLMFLPFIIFYSIFLILINKNKLQLFFSHLSIIIIGFGLSSFFWLPAFFEGKYTLRDIVTRGEYAKRFVDFKDFFYGHWSYGGTGQFTVQVGIVQWIVVVLALPSIYIYKKKNNTFWIVIAVLLSIFFITLFLMTAQSQIIWEKITTLQKFQFPWRFLSLTVFITSLFGAFSFSLFPKNLKPLVLFLVVCFSLLFNKDYWHANGYLIKSENFFTGVYPGTTDTGESSPIWSVRFMEHKPDAPIEVIDGRGLVRELQRRFTEHTYKVIADEKIRIRENTLYFPGWHVFVDGKEELVEFQDQQHRGLLTFFVPKGKHTIEVRFDETKLRSIADIITLLSLVILVFYGILEKGSLWRRFRLYSRHTMKRKIFRIV